MTDQQQEMWWGIRKAEPLEPNNDWLIIAPGGEVTFEETVSEDLGCFICVETECVERRDLIAEWDKLKETTP